MPRPPLPTLFDGLPVEGARPLPVIGEQKDIRYHATSARTLLNGPETTGMGFWSINPYTGCAFGCAYEGCSPSAPPDSGCTMPLTPE